MSIPRSQQLQARRLHSSGQQQVSWSTVQSPASQQSLRMGAVSIPQGWTRPPVQSPVQSTYQRSARERLRATTSFFDRQNLINRVHLPSSESACATRARSSSAPGAALPAGSSRRAGCCGPAMSLGGDGRPSFDPPCAQPLKNCAQGRSLSTGKRLLQGPVHELIGTEA